MNNKRELIIAAATVVVLAIPTMAWAFTGPLSADPPAPNVGDGSLDEGSYDWMNQMHDYMWNGATGDGSYDSMNQMHDYMWNGGELPEDFAGGPAGSRHPMGGGMWGDR